MDILQIGPSNPTYQSIQLRIGKKTIMAYFNESLTAGQIAHSPRMHLHPAPYYEVILFRQGSTKIITEQAEIPVSAGSVALVPPNLSHRLEMAEEIVDPLDAPLCATFLLVPDERSASDADGRLAEALFARITDVVVLENMEHCFHYIDETTMELYRVQTCYLQIASNELENFFICLLRVFGEASGNPRPEHFVSADKYRMMQIEDYLSKAVTGDMTCSELAKSLHLSVRQLERLIHKLYGKSYRSLVYEMRMKYAQQLLATSNVSLQEISELLGYASVNAFHSAYRRFFGVTPICFRRSEKKRAETDKSEQEASSEGALEDQKMVKEGTQQ